MTREDRPVLAKGSRVVRQVEGGKTRFVVRAGATGRYLRVGEAEATLLGLMDGSRTAAGIRTGFVARMKEALEPADLAAFVARMRREAVVEPTAEGRNLVLVEKARQRRKERMFAGKAGALFFMRMKLVDPDRLLTRLEGATRFVFTRAFLVFAALLVASAVAVLVLRSDEVAGRIRNFLLISAGSGTSFAAIWATALGIVALHELGHGVACKHFGGEVHEMGFLLMFFQPCFYCNVNDAWTFESRAARLWVTAAGSFVEVVLGSASVLVWAATEPGTALHGAAYLVFMVSLSGTLLFNMNPLIKLDGYYLLADLLRIENLRDRAFAQVGWLFRGVLLGQPAARVTEDRREAWILAAYGIGSAVYQALLVITILAVLLGALSGGAGPGVLTLALLAFILWMMLRRPLTAAGGAMKQIAKARAAKLGARGIWIRAGAVLAGAVLVSVLLPWTRTSAGTGSVAPCRVAEVRSPLEGLVAEVLVADGARVAEGQPLVRVDAPVEAALARVDRETAGRLRRDALRRRSAGDAIGAEAQQKDAEAAEIRAAALEERLRGGTLRSPLAGVVLTRRVEELPGATVHRESGVIQVGDLSRVRVRVLMDAHRVGPLHEGMEAVVRLRALPGDPLRGKVVSISRQPLEEKDERMQRVTGPHWEVVVEAANPGLPVLPGMTGEVRVEFERTTLAAALVKEVRGTLRSDLFK